MPLVSGEVRSGATTVGGYGEANRERQEAHVSGMASSGHSLGALRNVFWFSALQVYFRNAASSYSGTGPASYSSVQRTSQDANEALPVCVSLSSPLVSHGIEKKPAIKAENLK